jgi:signal peptidase I
MEPFFSDQDAGDLAPAGIGSNGAAVTVSGLQIYRDKYYIATTAGGTDYKNSPSFEGILEIFSDPARWESSGLFAQDNRRYVEFVLGPDQFLPLGDNSPQSFDGRFWRRDGDKFPKDHNYVERDLLIGKALLIYWPHTWNRPIPFTPNFTKMGPIR